MISRKLDESSKGIDMSRKEFTYIHKRVLIRLYKCKFLTRADTSSTRVIEILCLLNAMLYLLSHIPSPSCLIFEIPFKGNLYSFFLLLEVIHGYLLNGMIFFIVSNQKRF